ncbi:hypothetical protein F5144DRAFT_159177 [Chaetomium tenue]|uniref:Uncharacterized protein n=1 Tax=Chaetomium tenue TaxID=1854479 RepID=A0ACB7PFL7_9PEZI|nr:hypothetical protein F5144DRAFT_159177 [Chaetomium globosum]
MRVAAGARMDEYLVPALRNYVMSHTKGVFETKYMTARVRPNLARVAFGLKAVREDKALFNELRNMSQTRDDGAPISVPEAEIAKFKERRDVAELRAQIQASTDKPEKNKLRSQISTDALFIL